MKCERWVGGECVCTRVVTNVVGNKAGVKTMWNSCTIIEDELGVVHDLYWEECVATDPVKGWGWNAECVGYVWQCWWRPCVAMRNAWDHVKRECWWSVRVSIQGEV